jgi:hypothetical protein
MIPVRYLYVFCIRSVCFLYLGCMASVACPGISGGPLAGIERWALFPQIAVYPNESIRKLLIAE